ncbi:nuclear transport factor 2 family protein [Vibrio kyushuensis]|uniref:nuclear transport factor 2 family protein n=1 Tax=Vibrio kyushuensis TaxID=2910249 RepID=UPI003D0DD950
MSEQLKIIETLESYAQAYCNKDISALMDVFDKSESISVIGTGADELCTGTESVRGLFLRNFSEATATKFEWKWRNVIVSDDHAVVAQTLVIHLMADNELLQVPLRWTVTLKKAERWLWMHRHASTAAGSQEEGSAYPTVTN